MQLWVSRSGKTEPLPVMPFASVRPYVETAVLPKITLSPGHSENQVPDSSGIRQNLWSRAQVICESLILFCQVKKQTWRFITGHISFRESSQN